MAGLDNANEDTRHNDEGPTKHSFKVRTVTCFLNLDRTIWNSSHRQATTVNKEYSDEQDSGVLVHFTAAVSAVRNIEQALVDAGYEVQTIRLATNPFPEWLVESDDDGIDLETIRQRLLDIDALLADRGVFACALGPALSIPDLDVCKEILQTSSRFSCSASLGATDSTMATAAAQTIVDLSHVNPLSNFCFCVASSNTKPFIPFFPAAKSAALETSGPALGVVGFAVGLENGQLLGQLLKVAGTIQNLHTVEAQLVQELDPLVRVCQHAAQSCKVSFLGVDTSLNPSLDRNGSVAAALENLDEVEVFGGPGTLAAAAALTTILQRLPIPRVGYCGLMLPLCEDVRLADLASSGALRISDLLSISHVCGVGVDTVPIPGDVNCRALAGLLLDVAAVAERWDKSLSCRVFPVPGKRAGESTTFDFPHLVNSKVLPL